MRERWFFLLIALLSASLLSVSSHARSGAKVVGGEPARIADWPGMVALTLRSKSGKTSLYFCGGTLIAARWVLTAAHCLHDHTETTRGFVKAADGRDHDAELAVVIGVQNLTQAEDTDHIGVARVVIHPTYFQHLAAAKALTDADARTQALANVAIDHGHDIALLELARPARSARARVSLANGTDPSGAARVRVAGFGYTNFSLKAGLRRFRAVDGGDVYAGSNRLLQASLGVIPTTDCRAHYADAAIGGQQICAGLENGGRDSCNGDSGGPLVAYGRDARPYQVGLVSWGKQLCGSGKSYGVYTRISAFADWIKSHVGALDGIASASVAGRSQGSLTPTELAEALSQLRAAFSGATRIKLDIEGPRPIRLGNEFAFRVRSPVAGRLLIFDINADRKVTLIFPNRFTEGPALGLVAAKESLTIPGPGYGFTAFQAREPVGQGQLLALVVPVTFDIETAGLTHALQAEIRTKGFAPVNRPTSYFMRFILQIERAVAGARATSGSGSARQWGLATVPYRIVR